MDFPSSSLTPNDIPGSRTFQVSSAWNHAFLLPATYPPWCVLEITATIAGGELKNAREHEDEHRVVFVLVNWQRFLYIAKSI
jgi:hypothetical protein